MSSISSWQEGALLKVGVTSSIFNKFKPYSSDELLLGGGVEDYEYLNKSRREVDGVDDKEEWNTLKVDLFYHVQAIITDF